MKKNRLTIFFIFLNISSLVFAATKTTETNDEFLKLLNNIQTMKASFKQFMVDEKGVQMWQKTSGLVMLKRPGKFFWEVKNPNKQLIIVNNNKLVIYEVDLLQATKRKMDYRKSGNPAALLSGSAQMLKQMFSISKLKNSVKENCFKLIPKEKNQNAGYQSIKVCFVNDQLKAMHIFDNLGQHSVIQFKHLIVNSQIPKNKFEFIAPKNVDVFDEE